MVKRKLNRLKRAEEKRILNEHKGLYQTLVRENYSQSEAVEERRQAHAKLRKILFSVAAGAAACVICVAGLFGAFKFILKTGDKNTAVTPSDDSVGIDVEYKMRSVNINTANNALGESLIKTDGVKFLSVEEYYNQSDKYYKISVNTRGSLEITAQVNRLENFPEAITPTEEYSSYVNECGFNVKYKNDCRHFEDLYFYTCSAVIDTGKEIYYLNYEYIDRTPECELVELIDCIILPKN